MKVKEIYLTVSVSLHHRDESALLTKSSNRDTAMTRSTRFLVAGSTIAILELQQSCRESSRW